MKGQQYQHCDNQQIGKYIADDKWVAEQKLDGVRVMVHVHEDRIDFNGVSGNPVVFAAAAQHFDKLRRELDGLPVMVLDGELIIATGELIFFDLPYVRGLIDPSDPLTVRRAALETIAAASEWPTIRVVPQAVGASAKQVLWDRVQEGGQEGVVMKRADGPYHVGARTTDVLKFKRTYTVDVVIIGRNDPGINAHLAVYKGDRLVKISSCSMIGKPDLQPGECAEIEFLYVGDDVNRWLYQPRLVRARPDKTPSECRWEQLDSCIVDRKVIRDLEVA